VDRREESATISALIERASDDELQKMFLLPGPFKRQSVGVRLHFGFPDCKKKAASLPRRPQPAQGAATVLHPPSEFRDRVGSWHGIRQAAILDRGRATAANRGGSGFPRAAVRRGKGTFYGRVSEASWVGRPASPGRGGGRSLPQARNVDNTCIGSFSLLRSRRGCQPQRKPAPTSSRDPGARVVCFRGPRRPLSKCVRKWPRRCPSRGNGPCAARLSRVGAHGRSG
jgi:hypothetical protein